MRFAAFSVMRIGAFFFRLVGSSGEVSVMDDAAVEKGFVVMV